MDCVNLACRWVHSINCHANTGPHPCPDFNLSCSHARTQSNADPISDLISNAFYAAFRV